MPPSTRRSAWLAQSPQRYAPAVSDPDAKNPAGPAGTRPVAPHANHASPPVRSLHRSARPSAPSELGPAGPHRGWSPVRAASGELALSARVDGAPGTLRFRTADGVHAADELRPAELRLVEELWGAGHDRVLVPGANYGVVGTVLAHDDTVVTMTETSARAAALCEHNLRANGATATVRCLADLGGLDGPFDAVAYAPRPDDPLAMGKQRLADALALLRPGGRCHVAGTDRGGLARYADCLRDLGADVTEESSGGDPRLVTATRPATVPDRSFVSPRALRPTVDGVTLDLRSLPGLFSASSLDGGTRLLLESLALADGDRVLDCCCGYAPVGVYAGLTADCTVVCTDDDAVATACARRSLAASGVDATVVTADCLEGVADRAFDRVLCNPPTHAGDGVLAELCDGARDVLAPDGRLDLVHHRALSLDRHLGRFGSVERVATGSEHVVVTARP